MAINQNHTAEELNGIKCAVVEKNASAERAAFLKQLLEFNHYTVVLAPSPPPKAAPPAAAPAGDTADTPAPPAPPAPETFTVGVTDVIFNPINAIFGRLLKAPGGHVVTLAYWKQQDPESHDETPYFESGKKN
ncbi:MAG TPA: hypothetical protein VMI35_11810 [Puia sp.]|nr:hypothetical protein [Puia sp.]